MPNIIFPEYREQFKFTKYPFMDTATLTSVDEDLILSKDVFCDASIYMPGAVCPVYIQKITIHADEKSITVTDYSKNCIATGIIRPLSDQVVLYNEKNKQVGLLVASQDLTYFTSLPYGEYTFTDRSASFAPRCVLALKDTGVTSISVPELEQLEGDVWLVGKQGVILRYVDNMIRVDIVGEPLFKREYNNKIPNFVQTINGIPSDEYGDFNISVLEHNDVLRVENSEEGITIYAAGV